jgi:hypothetical protein
LSQALNLMAQISVTKLIEVANIQEKNKYHVVLQKEKKKITSQSSSLSKSWECRSYSGTSCGNRIHCMC